MNKTASQILQEARALITAGWLQWDFFAMIDGQPRYCVLGAINEAMNECEQSRDQIIDLLEAAAGCPRNCLGSWNDCRSRTHEQVLAAFDKALTEATK